MNKRNENTNEQEEERDRMKYTRKRFSCEKSRQMEIVYITCAHVLHSSYIQT